MNTITPQNNIAFGAKYVNSSMVLKYSEHAGDYAKRSVSVLEFDPQNKKDLDALVKVAEKWRGAKFGDNIANTANQLHFSQGFPHNERIFMLTTQNTNYGTPDVKQILGLAQTSCHDGYEVCVDYLQTKPSLMNNPAKSRKPAEYKHVGEGMLNSLKKTFAQKSLHLFPLPEVVGFYEKNGFKEVSKDPSKFVFIKDV